jgi:hypothetical protein
VPDSDAAKKSSTTSAQRDGLAGKSLSLRFLLVVLVKRLRLLQLLVRRFQ